MVPVNPEHLMALREAARAYLDVNQDEGVLEPEQKSRIEAALEATEDQ